MKLKSSVNLGGVQPPVWFAMGVFEALCRLYADRPLVVTSANDSHDSRPASLHNKGLAFDARTKDMNAEQKSQVLSRAKQILDPLGFDIVFENAGGPNEHIHCEFDVKPGEQLYYRVV